ncbi:hypothetical protein ACODT5_36840 [Streptomyces sp. 5.8]|uniref:hypothetical protein n=1 Tax=Streptomyces sp. 5.8 TaxID=3406571 RepID=UPI003BB6E626
MGSVFEPPEPGAASRPLLPDRGRRRNRVNSLVLMVALGAVIFSGMSLKDSYGAWQDRRESRALIQDKCAGLADPDTVLALHGGTGRLVPDQGWGRRNTFGVAGRPWRCWLASAEDATKGPHFSLAVDALPREQPLRVIGDEDEPFRGLSPSRGEDATARAVEARRHPLGDGTLGDYRGRLVTVTARCERPARDGTTSVLASAAAEWKGNVSQTDVRSLAEIARTAADRSARQIGCEAVLPELPAKLAETSVDLGPAAASQGTCSWYAAFLRGADRGRLPDRSLGAPLAARTRGESCVLAASPAEAERIFPELTGQERSDQDLDRVLTRAPWWIQTQTYVGDEAVATQVPHTGYPVSVIGTKAGRGEHLRYASADCQGRPAAFTMDTDPVYARVLGPRLDEVFTAYATEAATRRGCTGLVLPGRGEGGRG